MDAQTDPGIADSRRKTAGRPRVRRVESPIAQIPIVEALATVAPLRRLWREEMRHHRGRIAGIAGLTLAMAGLTALYPVVISHALDM